MEKERAEMASEIVELEAKLEAAQAERESLAATLEAETKRHGVRVAMERKPGVFGFRGGRTTAPG
jgi:hypothetical protein